MNGQNGQMVLGVFFNHTGHHVASWRHPDADADANINFKHYVRLAQTAEKAKFHFLFFADWLATREASDLTLSRSAQYTAHFEPLTLLGGLAARELEGRTFCPKPPPGVQSKTKHICGV